MRPRTLAVPLLASCLVLVACGGGDDKKAATTTTTTAPATAAPAAAGDAAPLTGLPQPDAARRMRPALVVKIDNAPIGRPQTGFNQADVVVVEKVEGHITRLFSIFQTNDSDPIGPVRSARSTDIALVTPLNRPLFAYAGTNAAFQALVDKAPLVDVGYNKAAPDYKRTGGKKPPYNLFTNTSSLYKRAPAGAKAPPPLFVYRPAGQAGTGDASSGLHVTYQAGGRATNVDYAWDAGSGSWKRTQDGSPFSDSAGMQAAPKNVVVQFVTYKDTGQRDPSGAVVDEGQLIGSGDAWVFSDGKVVKGKWSKATAEAVTSYADATGKPVGLTPGTTWVELAPPGAAQAK
ncbi:MAG TPA: DUF3048 domain-containing protein [Acidimicrobiales bacterium]|nr:DUF3048 domain-containing protein [Acidimicrobiales bacterium]